MTVKTTTTHRKLATCLHLQSFQLLRIALNHQLIRKLECSKNYPSKEEKIGYSEQIVKCKMTEEFLKEFRKKEKEKCSTKRHQKCLFWPEKSYPMFLFTLYLILLNNQFSQLCLIVHILEMWTGNSPASPPEICTY